MVSMVCPPDVSSISTTSTRSPDTHFAARFIHEGEDIHLTHNTAISSRAFEDCTTCRSGTRPSSQRAFYKTATGCSTMPIESFGNLMVVVQHLDPWHQTKPPHSPSWRTKAASEANSND